MDLFFKTSLKNGRTIDLTLVGFAFVGGDEENRTPDPLLARQVLSQLSYTPTVSCVFLKVITPSKLNNISAP